MTIIRPATAQHEEAILGLWYQLVAYHRSIERIRPQRWSGPPERILRPLLAAVWDDPARQAVFVSVEDQEITGFVRVALVEDVPCPARIETLYVAPAHRAQRVGRALAERATRWCIDHGACEICVDFIAANTEARLL